MDEYLATILIGITVLLAMLIIFNLEFITGPAAGKELVTVSKAFEFGDFKATFVKGTKTHDLADKEIYNGVFFGENKIKYHFEAPEIEETTVKFTVARSNNLGPLSVWVNGQLVEQRNYAVGEYTVKVPKEFLNDSMTVEISAMSSLWQIWAPNLYDVRDVNIIVKSFAFEPVDFELALGEEYITFQEGRIEFSLEENVGRMAVLVNDKEIFSDYARNEQSVVFKKEDMKVGTNKIRIVPSLGSRFLGTVRAVVFYEVER